MTDHDDAHVSPDPPPDPTSARERGLAAMARVALRCFEPVPASRIAHEALVEALRCGTRDVRSVDAREVLTRYERISYPRLRWGGIYDLAQEMAAAWRDATREVTP